MTKHVTPICVFLLAMAGCSGSGGSGATAPLPAGPGNHNGGAAPQVVQQNDGSHFVEFGLPPGSAPYGITQGADGKAWFTEQGANAIASITYNGVVQQHPLPHAASAPTQIVNGPDNNLWFVEHGGLRIGRITPAGTVTEFALPANQVPLGITSGPLSSVWFTAKSTTTAQTGLRPGPDVVGRLTTSGAMTEYKVPITGGTPGFITEGSDGNLWFTDSTANRIGVMAPRGGFLIFPVRSANSGLGQISGAIRGTLYFVEQTANKVGSISLAGLTEYGNPKTNAPLSFAASPAGSITFIGSGGIQSFNRSTHAFSAPLSPPSGPGLLMSLESDGNLWFTENTANKIGAYVVQLQTASASAINFTAAGQTQTFTVHETNYAGSFTVSSSDTSVATVAAGSAAGTFTVTAIAAGKATLTVSDANHNTSSVKVTVTITAIQIN